MVFNYETHIGNLKQSQTHKNEIIICLRHAIRYRLNRIG